MKYVLPILVLFLCLGLIMKKNNTSATEVESTQIPTVQKVALPPLAPKQDPSTFKVCDVKKAKEALPVKAYQTVLEQKLVEEANEKDRTNAIYSNESLNREQQWAYVEDKTFIPEGVPRRTLEDFSEQKTHILASGFHPFVDGLHTAYAYHYPVTISPDMVWLLIAQGFAAHINQNGEAMRHYFVDFKGKKNLDVRRDEFVKGSRDNDWEGVFPEFNQQIGQQVGKDLTDLITSDFSTTGMVEKTAFQITLMDAMKSYFTYSVTSVCGIPEITLEGTTEDWKKIEEKTKQLAQYDLEWWTSELAPILAEFTRASKGKVKTKFWQSIYKWNEVGSGNPYITGWILEFFPYLKDYKGNLLKSQAIGSYQRRLKDIKPPTSYGREIQVTTKNFPAGLSKADFLWNYFGDMYKMEFVAGFVGLEQDSQSLSLRPVISWAVLDKGIKPSAKEIEAYKKGGDKEYLESTKKKE